MQNDSETKKERVDSPLFFEPLFRQLSLFSYFLSGVVHRERSRKSAVKSFSNGVKLFFGKVVAAHFVRHVLPGLPGSFCKLSECHIASTKNYFYFSPIDKGIINSLLSCVSIVRLILDIFHDISGLAVQQGA